MTHQPDHGAFLPGRDPLPPPYQVSAGQAPAGQPAAGQPSAGQPSPPSHGTRSSGTPSPTQRPSPPSRRIRPFLAGAAAGVVALAVFGAVRGGPELLRDHAAPAASSASAAGDAAQAAGADRREAIAGLLERRASALLRHDRDGFLATVDPGSAAFRARQADWFDNLAEVPLAGWRYRLGDRAERALRPERRPRSEQPPRPERPGLSGSDAVTARVEVAYQLQGHDRLPQRFTQTLTFDRRDGRWLVVGDSVHDPDGAGAGQPQLWDFGRVRAVGGRYGLVLGLGSRDRLREYAREVDRAVPRVRRIWTGGWSGRVVVVVPRTENQMAALLGGRAAQYIRVAAITRGELGATEDAAPADRVFINPAGFGRLSATGRQVIMAHEITHVATRAETLRWTPKWLSEGFADYVGFRDSGLATHAIAQELAADVRRGELPSALPEDAAFQMTRKELPQVYEQSWLACRLIAERYGQPALVSFYRSVGTGPDRSGAVEQAFGELGTTQAAFTRLWRAYLQKQLT